MINDLTNYNKILNFLDLIKEHPKKDVNYFFFDEAKKFIVMGEKLKSLPLVYHKHYTKEEFYVHVDVINRKVQFYSFDIKDYITGDRINESTGIIEWCKEVESSIYNFFALNIKELSNATYPYSQQYNDRPKSTQSYAPYDKPYQSQQSHQTQTYNNNNYYGSPAYKEREAFIDKINDLVKANKTAQATDFISETVSKMNKENKQSIVDDALRMIMIDKINIPVMVSLLEATKDLENLKERSYFLNKVRDHLIKLKSSRVDMVLKRVA
jgi:hypothetical protein